MDLKNATAVCLISLFAATLVVLIARALDSQAASQLEPRLAEIVEELRALRGQGGVATMPEATAKNDTPDNALVVYYFHSNVRCPTCRSIESQAEETVKTHFADELGDGRVAWRIVNYEQASAKPLADKFQLQMPVVVLARMKDGKIEDWKRLDEVWAMVGDKPAFTKYVRGEIERMLATDKGLEATTAEASALSIPTPDTDDAPSLESPAIPIPQ